MAGLSLLSAVKDSGGILFSAILNMTKKQYLISMYILNTNHKQWTFTGTGTKIVLVAAGGAKV